MDKAAELGCSVDNILIFSDEGVSGAILERPQLLSALDALKSKHEDTSFFICYDSSRLSRNAAHQLILVDEIRKKGAKLIFVKNCYQDNAEGRFQLTVMAAVDEYERARLKLRTEMGKRTKALQHRLTHNPGIYGYDFDTKTDTLSINEEQANNIRQMFRLLIEEGKGPAEITELQNDMEIASPRMKLWSRVTVRRILSNPSYLGTLYIRRYDTRDCHLNKYREKSEKIRVKERPENEWIPIKIPQLIDTGTWEKAQIILKNEKNRRRRDSTASFLLASLINCGKCGKHMNCKIVVKGDRLYRYYLCPDKYANRNDITCSSKLIPAEKIEAAVWNYVKKSISYYIKNTVNAGKILQAHLENNENETKNILVKKEKAKAEKDRIIIMYQKGYISSDELENKLANQEKKLRVLEEEIERLKNSGAEQEKRIKEEDYNKHSVYIMEGTLDKLDDNGIKKVIRLLIKEIRVDGSKATIIYK